MTFSTSVIPHPDAQGDWLPIFRSSRAPQVSRQGELTFSIERDASTSRLLEDESRRFQVMVILKDDGGTQDGGSDTSAPAHVDVVMIGTPQTVRFVRSVIDAPRALLVTWLFSDEASQANSKSNHEAPGKVTSFIVELRCWTGYGQLITEHESAVNFPADSTRGSVLFEDLDLAKEYVPVVSACNRLVCSNTQSGASSFALDVPKFAQQRVVIFDHSAGMIEDKLIDLKFGICNPMTNQHACKQGNVVHNRSHPSQGTHDKILACRAPCMLHLAS